MSSTKDRTSDVVNEVIKKSTGGNQAANAMAHAVLGAVTAQASGNSALAGAAGAATAELMAPAIIAAMGWDKNNLTEEQKQTVVALSSLAAGLAGGLASDSTGDALAGAQTGKNAVSNNYLSEKQKAQKEQELAECQDLACKAGTQAKWTAIDLGQDGSFAAGMVAGVPASLYEAVEGIVKAASSPQETYAALKSLFDSGDVLGNVSEAVKQSYIDRINKMEAEYQKAGANGSFNSGVEGGKLLTDVASLLAGGAGVAKGGAVLTQKVAAKVASKAESTAVNAGKGSSLSQSKVSEIVNTPKGQRPDPSTYMSKAEIDAHLAKFDDGAVRFTSMDDVKRYGTLGPDNGFVMPKSEFDKMIKESGGNLRIVEQKLGLESGYLSNSNTGVFYIEKQDLKNLKIPSGNEGGANQFWLPGGKTSGGISEAVVDFSHKPNAQFIDLKKYNGGK